MRSGALDTQRGQALVFALAWLIVIAVVVLATFGTGQALGARQRLLAAADAAAWSAALSRARVLNYHAYANRAIVAQEVMVAQAVTLVAWSRYVERFTGNASQLATLFPPVQPFVEALAQAASVSRQLSEQSARVEIAARAAHDVGYKALLESTQEVLHLTTNVFGMSTVAAEIARASDPRFFAFALPEPADGTAFAQLTRRQVSDADRARLRDVVLASLDAFVAGPRAARIEPPLFSRLPCPLNLLPWIEKRGGTTMAPDLERWEAADTLSLHGRSVRWRWLRPSCGEVELMPLGWGAAEAADTTHATGTLVGNPGGVQASPQAAQLAATDVAALGAYAGIARVRDVDLDHPANARFPTPRVVVLARMEGRDARTAGAIGAATGRLALPEALPGNRFWALAAAEVYFRRPAGTPDLLEFANLYNPWWQARLAAPTAADRLAASAHVR